MTERGAQLLHAQCWLWGQDLRSPQGDLLRAVGLERHILDGARSHRTAYTERLPSGQFAVAWSGGLLFGDDGGALFFPRLRFASAWFEDIRSPEDLGDLNTRVGAPPASRHMPGLDTRTHEAIAWLAGYEERVVAIAGTVWRAQCAEAWAKTEHEALEAAASVGIDYEPLSPLPPSGLAEAWHELAGALVPH